jgi:predicted membrane channel-forming protein YqfA (hemolysin III family)
MIEPPAPSWRKPFGMLLMLAIIGGWAFIVASFSDVLINQPRWAQAVVYVVAGLIWILPMGPLLRWMETGRWR